MDEELHKFIITLLHGHNTLSLATVREDGWPQATSVAYANDGLAIYVATGTDAQKVANIRRCNQVSLTIHKDYDDWNKIKGLSMAATAEVLSHDWEIRHAQQCLSRKFPQLGEMSEPNQYEGWAFLKITPKIISVINYERGFGHTSLVKL